MRGIGFWLEKREEIAPQKEAVVDGQRRLSYRQLNRRVNRLARALQAQGLAQGDRLAMVAPNCLEWLEVIMACAKLGLILVPLNLRLTPIELAFQLEDSGARTLIFDPELEGLARGILERVGFQRLMALGNQPRLEARPYEALLAAQSDQTPQVTAGVTSEAPLIIMYTAGTTGKPKGAVLTQGNCLYNALNLQVDLEFTSRDRDLVALPMFHIGGIGLFSLPMIYVGATVVIQRSFDPAEMLRLFARENITVCLVVPAIWLFLIQSPAFDPAPLRGARLLMSGGAPLPLSLIDAYHRHGLLLQQGYGMSEAAPSTTTLAKPWALGKKGSVGQVMFHMEARVAGEGCAELPRGQVGELLLRGPNLMQGYWNRPEANQEAFAGGWFHTGDLARLDREGFLYIVDRKKDMFISGGENVYPAEVENAIFALEQVAEAAVIGLPDPTWGEVGCAVVVVKAGQSLTAEQVTAHLKTCLAKYKIPKRVVFVAALPRNAAGKVLKRNLREQYT